MGLQVWRYFLWVPTAPTAPHRRGGGYGMETAKKLREKGVAISDVLENNDAYHALLQTDGLIVTGPTGTNVNDLSVLLIRR